MLRWKLRELMERQKLSDRELAAQVQIHESRINQLKSSYSLPNVDRTLLEELCTALDCTIFELLGYHQYQLPRKNDRLDH
jgi:DNA-binding Xre family transcriptional regulator